MALIRAMDWNRYVGQTVRVYRNLNNGRISVQAYAEGDWRVVAHVQDIVLECVSFSLREAARQRAVAESQRNVHAWAEGRLIGQVSEGLSCSIALGYNYRRNDWFVEKQSRKPLGCGCGVLVVRQGSVFVFRDALSVVALPVVQTQRAESQQLSLF